MTTAAVSTSTTIVVAAMVVVAVMTTVRAIVGLDIATATKIATPQANMPEAPVLAVRTETARTIHPEIAVTAMALVFHAKIAILVPLAARTVGAAVVPATIQERTALVAHVASKTVALLHSPMLLHVRLESRTQPVVLAVATRTAVKTSIHVAKCSG
jgi:hypothetical protein